MRAVKSFNPKSYRAFFKCANCGKVCTALMRYGNIVPDSDKAARAAGWILNLKHYTQSTCPDCNMFHRGAA